ncbi:MAG: class I SAM-dependent methyltransferase [Campylobacteraceae bacterium]
MNSLLNYKAIHDLIYKNVQNATNFNWNNVAKMYDGMARLEREFTKNQINAMPITKEDTVVDIGCGPGRLSVPMAKRAKSVTSVDAFSDMLDFCRKNAKEEGVSNINFLQKDWKDEDALSVVGMHDIVVASRSVGLFDIIKLNKIARKYVVLLSFANAPSLREIQLDFLKDITEIPPFKQDENSRMFNYNLTFNMVYDLGANPSVVVVDDGFEKTYKTKEEAYEHLRFVGDIPKDKEEIYRRNVDNFLTCKSDGTFELLRKTKTYVLWWKSKELNV